MLQLRPVCENCGKALPPNSTEAMICSFECTFCQDCVEQTLLNVCPNCGGGFEKRPIRPTEKLSKNLTKSDPYIHPVDMETFAPLRDQNKNIPRQPFVNLMPTVTLITTPDELEIAFSIRQQVFVDEQQVDATEEYDEFETSSRHFLARLADGRAVGTARWRGTANGTKLERFAVLAYARGLGVGKALVQAVLNDVKSQQADTVSIYLHAQLTAMPLYASFGFLPVGERFWEAGIEHVKMTLLQL